MALLPVRAVWWRRVLASSFWNIEHSQAYDSGGWGSLFIEVPGRAVDETLAFTGGRRDDEDKPARHTIVARVIGAPSVQAPIDFGRKSGDRMILERQNRFAPSAARHPAWDPARGFPAAPPGSTDEQIKAACPPGLTVYLVQTADGSYWAGFKVDEDYPQDWPDDPRLRAIYEQQDGVRMVDSSGAGEPEAKVISQIFDAWSRGRGALLYGPPGTGKTRILSTLWQMLAQDDGGPGLLLDTDDAGNPFRPAGLEVPLPTPLRTDWLTFHQNTSYADLMLGLRPQPEDGGTALKPRMGRLLDAIWEVADPDTDTASAVIVIDEINRANAARAFGEMLTFLDAEYRAADAEGKDNPLRVPVPLPQLDVRDGRTQELQRPLGGSAALPHPFHMPHHVYLVASMNSVDRAAIPLDSALARRFDRIDLRPDLALLAGALGLDWTALAQQAEQVRGGDGGDWERLSAEETAVLLLDRLNVAIAADMGEEFELGHGLLWEVVLAEPPDRWTALTKAWDAELRPQLEDRCAGRPQQLARLLKVDDPPEGGDYAFRPRARLGVREEDGPQIAQPVRLAGLPAPHARRALRWLAR